MREAIKFLASEGLIELVPGRGALVKALTPRDVEEMLQVQTALEVMGAQIACRVATAAQIAELRAVHDEMMRHYAKRDRLEYYKRNQAFHVGVVRLAGNRFLAAQYDTIQLRLKRIRFLGNATPDNWCSAVAEHEAMIAALEARDGEALARAVTEHLLRTWDRVKDNI
jgi:DNA-binding GntR family transcriptional regulator